MNHLPIAQLTAIIVLDGAILVGVIAWSVWSGVRRRHIAHRPRALAASTLAGAAAILLVVSVALPWGRARGDVDRIPLLAVDARPADTVLGSAACFITAGVACLLAFAVLRAGLPRVLIIANILLAGAWIALCIDVVLAVSAVDDITALVGGVRAGHASVGPAVWLAFLAGSALLAATAVGFRSTATTVASAPTTVASAPTTVVSEPSSAAPSTAAPTAFTTGDQW